MDKTTSSCLRAFFCEGSTSYLSPYLSDVFVGIVSSRLNEATHQRKAKNRWSFSYDKENILNFFNVFITHDDVQCLRKP